MANYRAFSPYEVSELEEELTEDEEIEINRDQLILNQFNGQRKAVSPLISPSNRLVSKMVTIDAPGEPRFKSPGPSRKMIPMMHDEHSRNTPFITSKPLNTKQVQKPSIFYNDEGNFHKRSNSRNKGGQFNTITDQSERAMGFMSPVKIQREAKNE